MKHPRLLIALLVAASLAPAQRQGDVVIAAAREAAAAFTASLPNYIVERTTRRYRTDGVLSDTAPCSSDFSGGVVQCLPSMIVPFKVLDVVTADVVEANGNETYLNLKVDGKPSQQPKQTGSWSEGEFSRVLQTILSAKSAARFSGQRSATLSGRDVWRYDFSIDQPHSGWHLTAGSSSYTPAQAGRVWIDKETSRVLRIEMSAHDMPSDFAMKQVDSSLDYAFVQIGENKYLLPTHSETVLCQRSPVACFKNATDFQNYRKYSADAVMTFGN